ncbi:uncharacterized protein LOC135945707 isoform X1 [Cloeon dipterum]|uniref:uncharacterized protein LOC135945707 isoform X1 n=1 Tax=Cloeon dipterum TaxID=197152 RepID=UPI00321F84F8
MDFVATPPGPMNERRCKPVARDWPGLCTETKSQSETQLQLSEMVQSIVGSAPVQFSKRTAMTGDRTAIDCRNPRLTQVFHKISWSQDGDTMADAGILAEKKAARNGLVQPAQSSELLLCPWESDVSYGVSVLAARLEEALRRAKSEQLSCGEVLLPATLLPRVASDVARLAEDEPCGLRGCSLVLKLDERPLGRVPCEAVATFEVYVTLKQDLSPWQALLPQFLQFKRRPSTIVLSPTYEVRKRRLFR